MLWQIMESELNMNPRPINCIIHKWNPMNKWTKSNGWSIYRNTRYCKRVLYSNNKVGSQCKCQGPGSLKFKYSGNPDWSSGDVNRKLQKCLRDVNRKLHTGVVLTNILPMPKPVYWWRTVCKTLVIVVPELHTCPIGGESIIQALQR